MSSKNKIIDYTIKKAVMRENKKKFPLEITLLYGNKAFVENFSLCFMTKVEV